jgi:hypothetical protein
MSEIVMRDITRAGRELGRSHLADLPSRSTVGALLETRIRREIAAYNAEPGQVFVGLVQPHDTIRHSDGFRMRAPRRLDADAAVTAARGAVAAGMLAFLLGDDRLTHLEQVVDVDAHDEILAVLERPVVAAGA